MNVETVPVLPLDGFKHHSTQFRVLGPMQARPQMALVGAKSA